MRVAIIGTGISGNTVANLICRDVELTVYESKPRLGGHSHTVDVKFGDRAYQADIGFMVFNDRTYPGFCKVLDRLGIDSRPSDMSFSVQSAGTKWQYQGSTINGLFAQRKNLVRPKFLGMLRDVTRFHRAAFAALERDEWDDGQTTGEFLNGINVGEAFRTHYLLPMAAAIWSSKPSGILDFPAKFLIGFFRNHGLIQLSDRPQWRTILGGSQEYVSALTAPFADRIRLAAPVARVTRHVGHVTVETEAGEIQEFDEVVFACHADQTLRMLSDATEIENAILSAFPYQKNSAILHTDTSVLPSRRRAWASWNYYLPQEIDSPASVTYDLSRLQGLDSPRPILLTLNPTQDIKDEHRLDEFQFEHPEFGQNAIVAQDRFADISGKRRTHFCGAYWRYGFHEDGLQSGLRVAAEFGKSLHDLNTEFSSPTTMHASNRAADIVAAT